MSLAKMINQKTALLGWKGPSDGSFLQKEGEKNHVKRNSGSSLCIVCLYYSFYQIVNLCNSIIGDIVEFLTVYTFKFIYVMFVLSITIWISKKHVDFCNKDAIWNGSQLEKKEKKDKSITNLKEFGKFMNHSKNYNNHQKSCNSGLFWKERKWMCMLACVWAWVSSGYVCVFYVGFVYMKECHSVDLGTEVFGYEIFSRITPSIGWSWKWKRRGLKVLLVSELW